MPIAAERRAPFSFFLLTVYGTAGGLRQDPERAVESLASLVAAQFDTVAAAVEGCDALVSTGMMPEGGWL